MAADVPIEPKARVVHPVPSVPWSAGMPPEVMTDFLVAFLRAHFADPANIEDATLRQLVWADDPGSPIGIESVDRWDPRLVELRPGLIVKDHGWRPQRISINDQFVGGMAPDGSDEHAILFNSSNTVFCIGEEPKAAKRLSTEVTRELVKFAPLIRRELGLVRFVVVERGDCSILEESSQNYVVPVVVAYQSGEQWRITPQVSRLRKIILQVTTKLYGQP